MKKLLLIIAAIFTLTGVHADLFFHESFDKAVGNLCTETFSASTSNSTDWYNYATGGTTDAQVVEGTLSYPNYGTASAGGKLQILQKDKRVTRQFTPVKSGKVYCSAIINVDKLYTGDKNKWQGVFVLAFGNGSASTGTPNFAQLFLRSVKDGDNYVGYQLAVAKNGELGTASNPALVFSETLNVKTDYLIVIEYEFVDGDMNDIARLYINPTKETTSTTLTTKQEVLINSNNKGAGSKSDATSINLVYTRPWSASYSGYSPELMYIDEIKVATSWDDLFAEGGETPIEKTPEITAPTSLSFGGQVYAGVAATTTFTVKGKNLKGDITLTVDNDEITLSKTTIAKADAESEAGVEVTATLLPVKGYFHTANITLSSTDATDATIKSSWFTYATINCSTIAAINEEAAKVSGDDVYVIYTGTAYVTYVSSETVSSSTSDFVYIQDNTAAIKIMNTYTSWNEVKQWDEVTQFALELKDPTTNLLPITTLPLISVLSHNNSITPQVVTLAELKANPADYLNELVKVENITLDQTSTTFGNTDDDNNIIPDYITQNGVQASIKLTNNNELIGTTKPKTADLIGLSTSKDGSAICVRGKADVISKDAPTAIENITLDILSGDYEIYTVSGQRIDALQSGINIIRKGNNTYKVVR